MQAEPLPPVSCFDYSSTLKMKAIFHSETLAILRTTRGYNPENRTPQQQALVVIISHCFKYKY